MKEPTFVRSLTDSESAPLRAGLRSGKAFPPRRCQLLLASAEGRTARQSATLLGCSDPTVRTVRRAFEREGVEGLKQKSSAPQTRQPALDSAKGAKLRALLPTSPRTFNKHRSLWTLHVVAAVCFEGLTKALGSEETLRGALRRVGVSGERARDWIPSPAPG